MPGQHYAPSHSGSLRQDRGYTLSVSGSGRTTMSTALCTIPLWVRPDHHVHSTQSVQFLSGSGRTTMFTTLCTIPLWVRPDHNVHSTLYNSSLGQVGPPCSQHSVQFLYGSGRTTMSTARSALSPSGSGRTTIVTALCTIPLWVRPDHHVHSTLYNSSLGQAGPQCPQHVLHCPSLGH